MYIIEVYVGGSEPITLRRASENSRDELLKHLRTKRSGGYNRLELLESDEPGVRQIMHEFIQESVIRFKVTELGDDEIGEIY